MSICGRASAYYRPLAKSSFKFVARTHFAAAVTAMLGVCHRRDTVETGDTPHFPVCMINRHAIECSQRPHRRTICRATTRPTD